MVPWDFAMRSIRKRFLTFHKAGGRAVVNPRSIVQNVTLRAKLVQLFPTTFLWLGLCRHLFSLLHLSKSQNYGFGTATRSPYQLWSASRRKGALEGASRLGVPEDCAFVRHLSVWHCKCEGWETANDKDLLTESVFVFFLSVVQMEGFCYRAWCWTLW